MKQKGAGNDLLAESHRHDMMSVHNDRLSNEHHHVNDKVVDEQSRITNSKI